MLSDKIDPRKNAVEPARAETCQPWRGEIMMGRVTGKVACVTGAASGIGRATALFLAREGASVVATDIQADEGASLLAELAEFAGTACFLPHDVTDEGQWQAVIAEIRSRYGRLDILVNNAGIGFTGSVVDMSLERWRLQMAVNVDGVFLGVKHGLPLMRASGQGGSIINVSSIAGIKASAGTSGYCASKGAVRLFTKSVALECAAAKDGVRVNSLHPGVVETAIWDTMLGTTADGSNDRPRGPMLDAAIGDSIPLGFKGSPEDMAEGILWLASDESRYVTGSELVIDGGKSIA
jgi:NAD(P)-dependent dehydrogenase (short-subunit alcohol dehydrogenase family)